MSSMTPERAQKIFVQTARNNVRYWVNSAMTVIRTGQHEEYVNSYTGKTVRSKVDPKLQIVVDKLAAAGLNQDMEFLEAFNVWLTRQSSAPIFGLFTALDGEGAYAERGIWFEVHAKNVGVLTGDFHDSLYPIDGDLLKD